MGGEFDSECLPMIVIYYSYVDNLREEYRDTNTSLMSLDTDGSNDEL